MADSSSHLDPTEELVDRRNFLQRLLSAPVVATKAAPRRETEAELRARIAELEKQVAATATEGKPPPIKCNICGSTQVLFDNRLDINVCRKCGAHETPTGWNQR